MDETEIIFKNISALLEPSTNSLVSELLLQIPKTEISFRSTSPTPENKKHLISIYITRQQIEHHRTEKFVFGFEDFIPSLMSTEIDNIRTSTFTLETGTYIVFTDDNARKFIGVLYTKRTLNEVRKKYKSEVFGGDTKLSHRESKELIYKNGFVTN